MNYAVIVNGRVDNVIVVDPENLPDIPGQIVPLAEGASIGWTWDGESFAAPPAPDPLVRLTAYAADKRWQVETGGIVVAGIAVATDDRSKLMLMAARVKATSDPEHTEPWHAADDQVHILNAATIIALSDAVATHVSGCFARYAAVRSAIQSDPPTVTSTSQIDAAFADVTAPWAP